VSLNLTKPELLVYFTKIAKKRTHTDNEDNENDPQDIDTIKCK